MDLDKGAEGSIFGQIHAGGKTSSESAKDSLDGELFLEPFVKVKNSRPDETNVIESGEGCFENQMEPGKDPA